MTFSLKQRRRIDYPIPAPTDFEAGLEQVLDKGAGELRYVFKAPQDRQLILDGAKDFFREFSHKEICLSDGRTAYFRPDLRAFDRGAVTAWAEYCIHSVTSSGKKNPGKEFAERIYNHHKRENMDRIEPIIREENVFGKFDDKDPAKDSVIFTGVSHDGKMMEIITRLDQYGNINADLTEVTTVIKRKNKKNPPHRPLTEVVESVASHQGADYSLSTIDNLQHENEKVKSGFEKKQHFNGKGKTTMQTTPENNNIPATEEQRLRLAFLVEHHCLLEIPQDELNRLTSDRAEEMISAGKKKSLDSMDAVASFPAQKKINKGVKMKREFTNEEIRKGLTARKFECSIEGFVFVRGVSGALTYIRLGVLPVNSPETRSEILHRLRIAGRKGAGRSLAKHIFAQYAGELNKLRFDTDQLGNGIQVNGQKNVSAEKPKMHV